MNTKVIRKINLNTNNEQSRYGVNRRVGSQHYDSTHKMWNSTHKMWNSNYEMDNYQWKQECNCCKKLKCAPCSGGSYGKYDRSPCAYKNMRPVSLPGYNGVPFKGYGLYEDYDQFGIYKY
jgi:hypothetical protein